MGGDSPHIIVTEVPPGFLMRRNVRSHFSRFGTIVRMTIQNSYCVITFENREQARIALENGTKWKDMPMKIDFTPNHDPFGTDDALINEELNWFAEDPHYSSGHKIERKERKERCREKERSRKYKSDSRYPDFPPFKLTRVDLAKDMDIVDVPDEKRPSSRHSDESKCKKKTSDRKNATSRFLEDLKSKPKVTEVKSKSKSSDETKSPRSSEENRSTKFFEEGRSTKSPEEGRSMKTSEEGRSIMRIYEETKAKPPIEEGKLTKFSDLNRAASKFTEEIKVRPNLSANIEAPFQLFDEPRMSSKLSEESRKVGEERSATPKLLDDNKLPSKPEESRILMKTSDPLFFNKAANTLKDRLTMLEERDRQIRLKLEKVARMETSTQGTCPDMCPEKERIMRELRGIVAPYEALVDGRMDHGKAVKEYARSSADQEEPLPHDLRPQPVLTMTMSYLINCIISRIDEVPDENLGNWYDFCWGRLRAIRKDIIQQQLRDKNTVMILEQCARFHIACYDRLWGTSKSQFDDKINTETLVNCLQSLIHMYEDLQHDGVICSNEAEFNAYLMLLKINSGFLASEYQRYSKNLKESKLVKEAVKIHLAYNNNMFSTYFKLAKQTSYLNACLMQRFFQHVRVQALNTIVKAHSVPNKLSNISVQFIIDMLKLDGFEDCVAFGESMGLSLNENEKSFRVSRNDFNLTENIYNIETPSYLVLKKRIPIAEAVVGSDETLPIYLNHVVHSSFKEDGVISESAIDASDQEEKMLRDDVERKLLMSHLKTRFVHKNDSNERERASDVSENVSLHDLKDEEIISDYDYSFYESKEDSNFETAKEIEIFDDPETFEDSQSANVVSEEILVKKQTSPKAEKDVPDSSVSSSVDSPKFSFVNTDLPQKLLSEPSPMKILASVGSSPISKSSPFFPAKSVNLSKCESSENKQSISFSKFSSPQKTPEKPIHPTFLEKVVSPKTPAKLSPKTPEKIQLDTVPLSARPVSRHGSKTINKRQSKNSSSNDKLRKKLSENMKRISARKYLRLWKEKASKIKSAGKFEAMILHNMPTDDYIKLWGKPSLKRSFDLANQLSKRKNSNLMVQIILHTDLINKVDKNVRKIGQAVVNTLGEVAVKKADAWGNIAQPNPVFWKLIFALPPPPEGGSTFALKLRSWCKAAFYFKTDSDLGGAELQLSEQGVPVFSCVTVVEGLEGLDVCSNLTALIVIRARGWESTLETEERVKKFLTYQNVPIPLAILNLGEHLDHVDVKNKSLITYFNQSLWTNSRGMVKILCAVASNIYLCNLKVKPFCSLMEICSEKLLDFLLQDSFLHDGLEIALNYPNNIIFFYNQLVNEIEKEIIHCKVTNLFGTAYDFREDVKKYGYFNIFPDNYKDANFEKSLSLRCKQCKLRPFKTDFKSKKDLIAFFKNYCDDIGCTNLLKQLLRFIKLPDDDDCNSLSGHLRSIQWLPLVEMCIKEVLSSPLLTFKVVYREDSVQSVFDSHFWLSSDFLKKFG